METQNKQHPSTLHLAALALGKLKPDHATKVQSHLSQCDECQQYLANTPRSELVELVRQARQKATSEQNTMATGLSGTIAGIQGSPLVQQTPPGSPPSHDNPVQHNVGENEIPHDLYSQSKYRIVRVLGRGGMGTVYEAEHVRMKRLVAIKVINPELVNHPQALARFEEEIRAVASLDHVNIARAFDAESIGALQVFVMEFVRGQTLYDFLQSRGQLSVVDACRCVRQALIGLQHAHEQGLVHRDLKPQNLMLTRDTGQIKILDFGLAKAVSENRQSRGLTSSRATMGTYAYMAPEQALDAANADIRADIYSLGCTLYYLISGVLPFDYETDAKLLLAHQTETPCPLHELCPDVPESLSELVSRMLAKNPADRPQTPREAADALLPFARGQSAGAAQPHAVTLQPIVRGRGFYRGRPNRRIWIGIAAAVVALLIFGGWAAGLFSVRTPYGTIVVENAPADANVSIDGNSVTVTRNGDSLVIEAVGRGPHHLKLLQGGREIWSNDVQIDVGGQQLTFKFKPEVPPIGTSTPKSPPGAEPRPPAESTQPAPKTIAPEKPDRLAETPSLPRAAENPPTPPTKTADGFLRLFNGRDLTNWKKYDPRPGTWKIENGVLIGRAVSHLYSERDDYRDTHLRVRLRLSEEGRFCLYVRGGFGPRKGTDFPDGLELTYGTEPAKHRTLYANGQPIPISSPRQLLTANKLTQVDFVLRGDRVTVSIDGKPTIDEMVPKSALQPSGRIILQSKLGDVQFESVEVKELPVAVTELPAAVIEKPQPPTDSRNDVATLFPTGSRWTGKWDGVPATATITRQERGTVVFTVRKARAATREFWCNVDGNHLTLFRDIGVSKRPDGLRPITASNLQVDGRFIGGEVSLAGTVNKTGSKGKPLGRKNLTLTLRREDASNETALANAMQAAENGYYNRIKPFITRAAPDLVGDIIAKAIADAGKQMPTPLDALVLGELCMAGGRSDAAETAIQAGIQAGGTEIDYRKSLALSLLGQGKIDEARKSFQETLKDHLRPDGTYDLQKAGPDSITAAYFLDLVSEQHYIDRLAGNKALACFPWFYIGQRREFEGKLDAAVAAYERCVELVDNEKPHFVYGLGRWRLAAIDEQRAESEEAAENAADPEVPAESDNGNASANRANTGHFVSLFNGKDTSGWNSNAKDAWAVNDGILTGKGAGPGFLFTDRADFDNVHVRVKARINDGGNSGVFVRWHGSGQGTGYEAQINSTARDPNRTGTIYTGADVRKQAIAPPPPPNEWFVEEIIVQDKHVTVWVNGNKTAEFEDSNRVPRGRIGLQKLDAETTVDFESIEVKELPSSLPTTASAPQSGAGRKATGPKPPPNRAKKKGRK